MDMNNTVHLKAEGDRTRREDKQRFAALIEGHEQEIRRLRETRKEAARKQENSKKELREEIHRLKSRNGGSSWQVCAHVRILFRHNRHYVVVAGLPASLLCTAAHANQFRVPNLLGNNGQITTTDVCEKPIRTARRGFVLYFLCRSRWIQAIITLWVISDESTHSTAHTGERLLGALFCKPFPTT